MFISKKKCRRRLNARTFSQNSRKREKKKRKKTTTPQPHLQVVTVLVVHISRLIPGRDCICHTAGATTLAILLVLLHWPYCWCYYIGRTAGVTAQDTLLLVSLQTAGNRQETEACMVRACHTPRQPLPKPSFTAWSAEELLDGQYQRVDISAHARPAHKGLLQKRLEEDLC